MLRVAYVVEMGALVSLPIVDHRLGDVVVQGYDVPSDVDCMKVGVDGTDLVQCPVVI